MSPSTRRELLRLGTATVGVAIAGCLSASEPEPTPTETGSSPSETPVEYGIVTPHSGECEEQSSPTPTATKELEPKSYPEYPGELMADTARSFALAYELAYRHNWVVATDWMAGTDGVTFEGDAAPAWATREYNAGYIVGVTGELKTGDTQTPTDLTPDSKTSTQVPFLSSSFSAWYYLTPEFVLRKERKEAFLPNDRPKPDLTEAVPIVCQ